MNPYKTLLLVGPTGSGKTPLGDLLQEKGLWDKRCVHFDFGANLRKIAETPAGSSFFTNGKIDIITHSLSTGVLLENENFHIAEKIQISVDTAPDDIVNHLNATSCPFV